MTIQEATGSWRSTIHNSSFQARHFIIELPIVNQINTIVTLLTALERFKTNKFIKREEKRNILVLLKN